jgi:hypothetical protein
VAEAIYEALCPWRIVAFLSGTPREKLYINGTAPNILAPRVSPIGLGICTFISAFAAGIVKRLCCRSDLGSACNIRCRDRNYILQQAERTRVNKSGFPDTVVLVQISDAEEVAEPAPATAATAPPPRRTRPVKGAQQQHARRSRDYGRVERLGRRARSDGAQCEEAEDRGGEQHGARRTCGGGENDAVRTRFLLFLARAKQVGCKVR